MPERVRGPAWLALGAMASAAWFVTAARVARMLGAHEAAPAIGLLTALAVAIVLWHLARTDIQQAALAALRCPRCRGAMETAHEHARSGGLGAGLQRWRCGSCGYEHAESLTCADCAA